MAFLQSEPARQPMFRAPGVVLWLIAALALAHAVRIFSGAARSAQMINDYAFTPARYSAAFLAGHNVDPGTWLERALPFVTYMGLHNDWTHLGINCLWLLAFGPIVARRFGTALFLLFFVVCGAIGAATFLAFNWGQPVPVIGASGAISGLMAAGLRMLPGQAPWAAPDEAPFAPVFSRQILLFSAVWAAINLLAAYTGLGMGGESGLIAWQAHLGGYAAGLLLSTPFDLLRPGPLAPPLGDG